MANVWNINNYSLDELSTAFGITNTDEPELIKQKFNNLKSKSNNPDQINFFKEVENRLISNTFSLQRPETHEQPTVPSFVTDTAQDGKLNPTLRLTIDQTIVIDSQYRKKKNNTSNSLCNTNNPSSFTCDLNTELQNVLGIRLFSIQLPNSCTFCINTSNNSFWFIKEGLPYYKLTIPIGNYTDGNTLINAINNAVFNISSSNLMSFNTLSQTISILQNSYNINIIGFGTPTQISWINPYDSQNSFIASLGYLCGFRNSTFQLVSTVSSSIEANACIDLSPFKYFTICIDDFSYSSVVSNSIVIGDFSGNNYNPNAGCGNTIVNAREPNPLVAPNYNNTFAVLPISYSSQPIISYSSSSLQRFKRTFFGPVNINRLNIQIYNDKGSLIDLGGRDWSLVLMAEILYQY